MKAVNKMTGREVVNLIDILRAKGMSDAEIIETIRYVEMTEPKKTADAPSDTEKQ